MRAKFTNYVSNHEPQILGTPRKVVSRRYRLYSPWFGLTNKYHSITNRYDTALDEVFLSSVADLDILNDHNNSISRDGLIPLIDFFSHFPSPEIDSPHIVVNKEFIPYIPKEWSSFITQYENIYKPVWKNKIFDEKKRDQLIITFFPCSYIINLENIEKLLKDIDPNKFKKIYIFKLNGSSHFDNFEENKNFSFKALELINKYFNGRCELIFEHNIYRRIKFDETQLLELNHNGILWSDSFVTHKILSSGSKPIFTEKIKISDKNVFIDQSLNHGILLSSSDNFGEQFEDVQKFISTLPLKKGKRILDCKTSTILLYQYLLSKIKPKKIYLSE